MNAAANAQYAGGSMDLPAPPDRLYGILGQPLAHSMSPQLHTWGFSVLDIAAAYMRWELPPEGLKGFMDAVRALPISGVSVTIPHKEAVIGHLDGLSTIAGRIGAVNTLYWRDGKLMGENTDVLGFLAPLQRMERSFSSAMVLGAGGAARAVLAGLTDMGIPEIVLANRSLYRAELLAREFGVEPLDWEKRGERYCELLVNTTPLGMQGDKRGETPWPREAFHASQTVYDLVYNPQQTRFLREAKVAGCQLVDGLSMFLGQAMAQCRLWTGREFPENEAREVLAEMLR